MKQLFFNNVDSGVSFVLGNTEACRQSQSRPQQRILVKDDRDILYILINRGEDIVQWARVPSEMACHLRATNPCVCPVGLDPKKRLEKEIIQNPPAELNLRIREKIRQDLACL